MKDRTMVRERKFEFLSIFTMNTVRFSVVLFSIRDETYDYSCIFCDFKTFEKNKHDDHLCLNHKQEFKENYFELLKELPVLPTKNYQNVNPIRPIDEFFSDNIELPCLIIPCLKVLVET